jgi:hypothetical protein
MVQAAGEGRTSEAESISSSGDQSWYFAVSGDSRDCGDLIMPKIARSIQDHRKDAPVEFYWHLGDLRAIYRVDCDYAKFHGMNIICDPARRHPQTDKVPAQYLNTAWDDFILRQILPFGTTPFFLGIGNHELINLSANSMEGEPGIKVRDRKAFRFKFGWWMEHPLLESQRQIDTARGLPVPEWETYYHFIKNGVDFIYLDNAGPDASFSPRQLEWLDGVLKADAQDSSVKTIIAGMHAALPLSTRRGHAMDKTEAGFCTGRKAYEMLFNAQNADGPAGKRKFVYVMASHSHFFETDIYASPELKAEHQDRVLPGWIIGTAGAEQYVEKDPVTHKDLRGIMYGYLQLEVRADGSLRTRYREVDEKSQPVPSDQAGIELTRFCFSENKSEPLDDRQSKRPYECK